MAVVDKSEPRGSNFGHSEYHLLKNNALDDMLTSLYEQGLCPQYLILYSTLIPCLYSPKNSPYLTPRCAEMIVNEKKKMEEICPKTKFFLHTDQVSLKKYSDGNKLLGKIIKYLNDNGIIWI
jgi:hypothetical protein